MHAEYYRQRSGAGLIISEGLAVSLMGIGYVDTPGIFSQEQVKAWRPVTHAVHDAYGRIFAQLWHVGRISHPDFLDGHRPLAPSAINPEIQVRTPDGAKKPSVTPKSMTEKEISQTVVQFKEAARNAMDAGFDGVEIHSSNGYIFHQFFSNTANARTDRYGGTIENKVRFFFQTLKAVLQVVPANRVGVRLNPMMHGASRIDVDRDTIPTFDHIVRILNDYNLAYLHISRPFKTPVKNGIIEDLPRHFRSIYSGHLMMNGGYDRASAEALLKAGNADSVSFGRLFISNPDLPERLRYDHPLAIPDPSTFYSSGLEGYTTYPSFSPPR
jgi:N-ethylmaleimide reductase